ncbi:hypothetical protein QJS10_CPB19g00149 [Acorus calamus]|uniref:Uncharacterized protein n=1 Tax=Acorus calamus TaxID=4465 RepID=A0AAV9CK50_ACOCL|nr:hypothetical protein QJS10_CPB19g00149 [Acorus calamus]
MGNIVSSFVSGFTKLVGDLFGAPLDFLSGKSCSTVCGSTWDLICYIENFCVGNVLKLIAVLILFYIVLLFIYLLHKIGICGCIGRSICKISCACFTSSCFSACEYWYLFLWVKFKRMNRDHRWSNIEDYYLSSNEDDLTNERLSYLEAPKVVRFRRSLSVRSKERRRLELRRSLRPRSHQINVGISRNSVFFDDELPRKRPRHVRTVRDVKVTQTSRFLRKGSRVYRRRW